MSAYMRDKQPAVWGSRNDGLESNEDVLARTRRRLNAARVRGNKSWEELFKLCDENSSGALSWKEFLALVRVTLAVPPQTVPDHDLKILFHEADKDGSNTLDTAELFEYIQHGKRDANQERARLEQRLSRVRRNLQLGLQRYSSNEADVRRLFKRLDMDDNQRLSLYEFEFFVRHDLKMSRWDIMGCDLEAFYNALDCQGKPAGGGASDGKNMAGGDGIDVEELLAAIRMADRHRNRQGAQSFYTTPNVSKAKKKKTFRQELEEGLSHSVSLPDLTSPVRSTVIPTPSFISLGRNRRPTTRVGLLYPNSLCADDLRDN